MWVAAFLGMATKFAECMLAVKYREIDENGNVCGGPMYYIKNGMGEGWGWLAKMFALFGMLAGIMGIGTLTQVNSITDIVNIATGWDPTIVCFVIAVLVAIIIFGGLQSIANASSAIVPFMAVVYIFATLGLLVINADKVPAAFSMIINDAFTGTAATGGFIGSSIMLAMRSGVARGIFSNESGLGSAPIVAAAAKTKWPAEQGLVSMTGTFIDTIIICTLTGLTLIVTGVWCGDTAGAAMTAGAFTCGYAVSGKVLLMIGLVLFAFTTILGWNYYGERCVVYLCGEKMIKPYRILFICIIACAPFLKLEEIWALADIVNGLMAFPNLVALLLLSGVVVSETKAYMEYVESKKK